MIYNCVFFFIIILKTLMVVTSGQMDEDWQDMASVDRDKNECNEDNGGCSQICSDLPIGYKCMCRPGYVLVDNRTCEDINECDIPGSCSQSCKNTEGGYKCECSSGYMLEPSSNKRCRAQDGHTSILFTNRHDIRKFDIETSEYVSVVSNLGNTVALDYHYQSRTIYWSDIAEEAIKSVSMDSVTPPVTTIISTGLNTVEGIAVDWIYGNIYWTDTGSNTIEMSYTNGKMRKTIISSDLYDPRAIVLNPLDGWMYWTDWGDPAKIERAGMDGSHRAVVISIDIKWPNGLALDLVQKKIYWLDAKLHTLSCADFNGDNQRVILSSPIVLQHPFSIDIFEDWIYWSDLESEAIYRSNKFNGEEKTIIVNGIYDPMDVHVYHSFKQPNGTNYCSDMHKHCSHLCLPTPYITEHSPRYTCACPDGMQLTGDEMTCTVETVLNTTSATATASQGSYVGVGITSTTEYSYFVNNTKSSDSEFGHAQPTANYDIGIKKRESINRLKNASVSAGVFGATASIVIVFLVYRRRAEKRKWLRANCTANQGTAGTDQDPSRVELSVCLLSIGQNEKTNCSEPGVGYNMPVLVQNSSPLSRI